MSKTLCTSPLWLKAKRLSCRVFLVLVRFGRSVVENNLSLVSAGVAFYVFLSIFPAMATALSVYGLLFNVSGVQAQIQFLNQLLPSEVMALLTERINDLVSTSQDTLSLGVAVGILISLWSANRAMKAVATALNIAYQTDESRGFLLVNITTLGLTLLASLVFILSLLIIVPIPLLVSLILSSETMEIMAFAFSWAIMICLILGFFLVVYRFAPDLKRYPWHRLLPGALVSCTLFVLASIVFSAYVSNFGKYDKEYGALGAVVVTMLWLYLGSFIFLIGAEINSQLLTRSKNIQ